MKNSSDDIAVACMLGIDPVHEPQYLWIARRALDAAIDPEEWKEFTNEDGRLMYYNVKLKVSIHMLPHKRSTENPCRASSYIPVSESIPASEGFHTGRSYRI
jgi:hypothetical protein